MNPQEFISLGLADGSPVRVRLDAADGTSRTVRLFFRGYAIRDGASVARSLDDLRPLFSAPNNRGGINRRYYSPDKTTFDNISKLEIL